MVRSTGEVTRLLHDWSRGDPGALEKIVPFLYDDMHRLARGFMRRERREHTLQPTALLHEAYLNLAEKQNVPWQDRRHFLAVAAQVMRRILVTHARKRAAAKRGGAVLRFSLDEASTPTPERAVDLVALDDALTRLAAVSPSQSRVVELRFFGGLTTDEAAAVLDVSPATAKRKWLAAKAWLFRELKEQIA
jgi:RNA polymerase sigma-70 factor (ECF subfamily)